MYSVPCMLMRGGTSKGPFFRTNDLPADITLRDSFLLGVMGSGHELQIDGVGGGNPLSSKVAMVDLSPDLRADVDYLFAQVNVMEQIVDTGPNCGNMLVAVAPFAVERGLVPATIPETIVRIRNVNTDTIVHATVQTPDGRVAYAGCTSIDGVPGSAAPVRLTFLGGAGSKTASLLPTGNARELIQGIEVTLIDMAVPVVMIAASSLGRSGHETPEELDCDQALMARLESIRVEAGMLMGLGDVRSKVLPKIILVSAPRAGGTICGRYFMPRSTHKSFAVTGGICLAAACALEGSVASRLASWTARGSVRTCAIEHPSGQMLLEIELDPVGRVGGVSLIRTARKLFSGEVFAPDRALGSLVPATPPESALLGRLSG